MDYIVFKNENNNLEESTISNKQNFVPLYTTLHNDCSIDTKLNHNKTIKQILEKKSYSDYLVKLENGNTVPSFFKLSPIIEPVKYSIGKYKNINISKLPQPNTNSVIRDMDDTNNLAYIDSFFYYLTSILLNKYNFSHGVDFYDTFLGISEKFKYNISEEIETLINNSYFKSNHNKLFNIDNSDILGTSIKPKVDIGEEITIDNIIQLETTSEVKTSTETAELLYTQSLNHDDGYINNDSSSDFSASDTDDEIMEISSCEDDDDDYDSDEVDSDYTGESDIDEDEIYLTINNFPCQVICLEKLDDTFDSLVDDDKLNKSEWKSALFQVIMILLTYQKVFDFTHNDLHTNNIMYIHTKEKYLYYKYNNTYYKVPTYNRLYKIIDFGRSIYKFKDKTYFSNSFSNSGDAASQYNCEPYYNDKKQRVLPNKSFDISRLACSLFDYFYGDVCETVDCEIAKTIERWTLDDNGKNILYKKDNTERYPDFKLYKMISRTVHHLEPHTLLNEPIFKKFSVFEKQTKRKLLMDIDSIPKLYT